MLKAYSPNPKKTIEHSDNVISFSGKEINAIKNVFSRQCIDKIKKKKVPRD